MLRHFRDPQLVATFAIGFGVLFNFIATFTYISFHLAAPPYGFSADAARRACSRSISSASALTPAAGWALALFGRRRFVLGHHRRLGCRRRC